MLKTIFLSQLREMCRINSRSLISVLLLKECRMCKLRKLHIVHLCFMCFSKQMKAWTLKNRFWRLQNQSLQQQPLWSKLLQWRSGNWLNRERLVLCTLYVNEWMYECMYKLDSVSFFVVLLLSCKSWFNCKWPWVFWCWQQRASKSSVVQLIWLKHILE